MAAASLIQSVARGTYVLGESLGWAKQLKAIDGEGRRRRRRRDIERRGLVMYVMSLAAWNEVQEHIRNGNSKCTSRKRRECFL